MIFIRKMFYPLVKCLKLMHLCMSYKAYSSRVPQKIVDRGRKKAWNRSCGTRIEKDSWPHFQYFPFYISYDTKTFFFSLKVTVKKYEYSTYYVFRVANSPVFLKEILLPPLFFISFSFFFFYFVKAIYNLPSLTSVFLYEMASDNYNRLWYFSLLSYLDCFRDLQLYPLHFI